MPITFPEARDRNIVADACVMPLLPDFFALDHRRYAQPRNQFKSIGRSDVFNSNHITNYGGNLDNPVDKLPRGESRTKEL
jgi:hypothetical protein